MDRYWLGVLTVPLVLGVLALACALFYGFWQFFGAFLEAVVVRRRWKPQDRTARARVAAVLATSTRVWGVLLPGGFGMVSLTLRPRRHHATSTSRFNMLTNDFLAALTSYETTRADKD